MQTEKELNAEILAMTNKILEKYPELSKQLEEMPVTMPDEINPDINIKNLKEYLDSLNNIFNKYD